MSGKRFIMLGERNKKGQIAKNENYGIIEFLDKVSTKELSVPDRSGRKPTLFERIFNFDKLLKDQAEYSNHDGFNNGYNEAFEDIQKEINKLIDKDTFGKKKR